MTIAELRAAYDREMRAEPAPEAGLRHERVGPIVRAVGEGECCILFSDFQDTGAAREDDAREIDAAVAAQIAFCRASGLMLEWKLYGHDRPADLAARLAAAGLVPDEAEWLMALPCDRAPNEPRLDGPVPRESEPAEPKLNDPKLNEPKSDDSKSDDSKPGEPRPGSEVLLDSAPSPFPAGYRLERVTDDGGLARFGRASSAAFERDERARVEAFRARLGDPSLVLYVVMHGDEPVASARLDMPDGRRFASLWGGGIVSAHRRRGLYRALVAIRAADARARGYRVLTVDARQTSRPILARLGFVTLATVQGWLLLPRASV